MIWCTLEIPTVWDKVHDLVYFGDPGTGLCRGSQELWVKPRSSQVAREAAGRGAFNAAVAEGAWAKHPASNTHLSIYLSIDPSIYLSIYLYIYISIYIYVYIYMYVH